MPTRTIAGDCIVRFEGSRARHLRGRVLIVVKPDNTVLVHDADGYQPVAWLTRAEELSLTRDPLWLVAVDGDQTLRVEAAADAAVTGVTGVTGATGAAGALGEEAADADGVTVTDHRLTEAGVPVGDCRCGGPLVRTGGAVACLACYDRYPLPGGAAMLESTCDCGLPEFRVDRGETFELCLDYDCGSLIEAVRERFEGAWACPDCDGDLEILRRGGLLAGCEHYPDCETGFAVPDGTVVGECDCGLPRFETASGQRCLDSGCGA